MNKKTQNPKHAVVIGGGIGGLATACILAKAGMDVSLYEKNSQLGGRAGSFSEKGFTFDTGPSWFLMPEVFEHFFELFGLKMQDVLKLKRLSPGYTVFFEDGSEPVTIYGDLERDAQTFESIEAGAGKALKKYVKRAELTYKVAVESFLYTNFQSKSKVLKGSDVKHIPHMLTTALQPIDRYVGKYFKNPKLRQILEYPMVFLGTSPFKAPALYHLMSYMDFEQGVFYPMGGMYEIIKEITRIAEGLGVRIHTNADVARIVVENGEAAGVELRDGEVVSADIVVSNSDMHYTETKLLNAEYRMYPERFWEKKEAGPSALLMYLGVKGELSKIGHHTLLFTTDWQKNFKDIFENKTWPHPASIYVCKPSETDDSVAPAEHENIFVLVPVPASETSPNQLEKNADIYLDQIALMLGVPDLKSRIVYKKLFGPNDFSESFYSWKGTALGLSHRLSQSALFRPKNKSSRVKNLYYVGGNTLPGIGLPMCLIGAELVYKHLAGDHSSAHIAKVERI